MISQHNRCFAQPPGMLPEVSHVGELVVTGTEKKKKKKKKNKG